MTETDFFSDAGAYKVDKIINDLFGEASTSSTYIDRTNYIKPVSSAELNYKVKIASEEEVNKMQRKPGFVGLYKSNINNNTSCKYTNDTNLTLNNLSSTQITEQINNLDISFNITHGSTTDNQTTFSNTFKNNLDADLKNKSDEVRNLIADTDISNIEAQKIHNSVGDYLNGVLVSISKTKIKGFTTVVSEDLTITLMTTDVNTSNQNAKDIQTAGITNIKNIINDDFKLISLFVLDTNTQFPSIRTVIKQYFYSIVYNDIYKLYATSPTTDTNANTEIDKYKQLLKSFSYTTLATPYTYTSDSGNSYNEKLEIFISNNFEIDPKICYEQDNMRYLLTKLLLTKIFLYTCGPLIQYDFIDVLYQLYSQRGDFINTRLAYLAKINYVNNFIVKLSGGTSENTSIYTLIYNNITSYLELINKMMNRNLNPIDSVIKIINNLQEKSDNVVSSSRKLEFIKNNIKNNQITLRNVIQSVEDEKSAVFWRTFEFYTIIVVIVLLIIGCGLLYYFKKYDYGLITSGVIVSAVILYKIIMLIIAFVRKN